jgi:hypothetical protein
MILAGVAVVAVAAVHDECVLSERFLSQMYKIGGLHCHEHTSAEPLSQCLLSSCSEF